MQVYTPTSNLQECLFPHIHAESVVIRLCHLCQSDSWKKNYISVEFF